MLAPLHARRERAAIPDNALNAVTDDGLLTWTEIEDRLTTAHNYWVCTLNPDGSPHVRPLWGVYLDGMLHLDGRFESRWFRNLGVTPPPPVTVHLEDAANAVIIEGRAVVNHSPEIAERVARMLADKYPPFAPEPETGGYLVIPEKVFAWHNGDVKRTATRWTFERQ